MSEELERRIREARITRYCHEERHQECGSGRVEMTNGRVCECPCHADVPAIEVLEPATQPTKGA